MNNLIDENIDFILKSLKEQNTRDIVPPSYEAIADRFRKVKNNNETVIVEEGGFPHTDSIVMYIEHVTDRWVGGYYLLRNEGQQIRVPKTIHYSDIVVQDKSHKIKIIFEGANPYGE